MRALVVEAADAPFRLVEVERPRLTAGQVLVRIKASGVNPLDIKIRRGAAAHARHPLPAVLGLDLAGVVEHIGEGVSFSWRSRMAARCGRSTRRRSRTRLRRWTPSRSIAVVRSNPTWPSIREARDSISCDTAGGVALDASFHAVRRFGHVVSCLGWGTHTLAPLSFRAATYSGVFTLLPLLTGEGRAHHGEILQQAAKLIEAGLVTPSLDPRRFTFDTIEEAHAAIERRDAAGKIVVEV